MIFYLGSEHAAPVELGAYLRLAAPLVRMAIEEVDAFAGELSKRERRAQVRELAFRWITEW